MSSRVSFHHISSEHNTSFALLEVWFQLRILLSFYASQLTSFLHHFVQLPCWIRFVSTVYFCIQNFCLFCLRCDLRDFQVEMIPNVVSWIRQLPGILLNSWLFASVSWSSKCFFVPFLQGIAASIGTSNYFLPFFDGFLNSPSCRSMKSMLHSCFSLF